jgi:hypothetical protein
MHLPTGSYPTSRPQSAPLAEGDPSNQTADFSGAIQAALRQTSRKLGLPVKAAPDSSAETRRMRPIGHPRSPNTSRNLTHTRR